MSITLVQSSSVQTGTTIARGSTTAITASLTLTLTAGNTLLLAAGGRADGGGGVFSPSFADTHNTYNQINWADAATQQQACGLFWATNIAGGSTTITLTTTATAPVGLSTAFPVIAFAVAEMHGFGSGAIIQGNANHIQVAGIGPMALVVSDSYGLSTTTNYGSVSQQSGAAADIYALGANLFFTAISGSVSGATAPSMTSPYSYFIQENPSTTTNGATGVYYLEFCLSGLPLATTCSGGYLTDGSIFNSVVAETKVLPAETRSSSNTLKLAFMGAAETNSWAANRAVSMMSFMTCGT